jgi:hypothetical protein
MAMRESIDYPTSQLHLDALRRVAYDLIVQSLRIPLDTRAWLSLQLLGCADELDQGMPPAALPYRLGAIADALPLMPPDPVSYLNQILEVVE